MDISFERGCKRTDEWYTPPYIIESLGDFDLDPCAPSHDFYTARKCYTKEDNGLILPWSGRVWLNPPYKNPIIGQFMKRMAEHGSGTALVFNRMDTALWHDIIFPNAIAIKILRGRLKFVGIDGKKSSCGAGCGSVLVAFGKVDAIVLEKCGLDGKYIRL